MTDYSRDPSIRTFGSGFADLDAGYFRRAPALPGLSRHVHGTARPLLNKLVIKHDGKKTPVTWDVDSEDEAAGPAVLLQASGAPIYLAHIVALVECMAETGGLVREPDFRRFWDAYFQREVADDPRVHEIPNPYDVQDAAGSTILYPDRNDPCNPDRLLVSLKIVDALAERAAAPGR